MYDVVLLIGFDVFRLCFFHLGFVLYAVVPAPTFSRSTFTNYTVWYIMALIILWALVLTT